MTPAKPDEAEDAEPAEADDDRRTKRKLWMPPNRLRKRRTVTRMNAMLKSTDRPISQTYRLALLDLDGVVYRGKNPVEHAADSIRAAQRAGMQVEYTTNNSSRFQRVVAEQLRGFGLDVEPRQVITSSVVAARMVASARSGRSAHPRAGCRALREGGRSRTHRGRPCRGHPEAVIQGWYPDMTWQQMAEVSYAVERGALYLVTNRDLTIPRELGIAPGCGSMIQAVINATGVEPIASAGKPESAMYDEALTAGRGKRDGAGRS